MSSNINDIVHCEEMPIGGLGKVIDSNDVDLLQISEQHNTSDISQSIKTVLPTSSEDAPAPFDDAMVDILLPVPLLLLSFTTGRSKHSCHAQVKSSSSSTGRRQSSALPDRNLLFVVV